VEPTFAYRATAERTVHISWRGRPVTVLAGPAADRFLERVAATDADGAQLLMAKATGQFKRGNEKTAKRSRKR
jgi:hypothetical protein